MSSQMYNIFKSSLNTFTMPASVMSVRKNPDGTCGEIRFFAINEIFKKSSYDLFSKMEGGSSVSYEDFDKHIEGQLYTSHIPKEPKFEAIVFDAAWNGKHIHTYVDTTKMYGYWTEDILFPVVAPGCEDEEEPDVKYCQFMYTLNREMDTGKFASVSPDISSFVIKSCLELRNENDFADSINTVIKDLREYTDSYAAAILTVLSDQQKFDVISESVRNDEICIKDIFTHFPYEIVDSWEMLCRETDSIIIKDEADMAHYEKLAEPWVKTLRENDVKSLCLFPLTHNGVITGYLYITNFDVSNMERIKQTIELVSFFLTAEVANHTFLERLEYLSNVDMLTGVFNRNCMNVNVDELAIKLEIFPQPFNVAFCDLNGLKSINDNGGHDQGDKLLVYAADVLKEVFPDDKIYRAGGDEFTIISFDSKPQFEEKIRLLRERASDPEWLYFAIGYYHDESNGQLRLAMRYADEEMYKDKDKFYEKYPDKRR